MSRFGNSFANSGGVNADQKKFQKKFHPYHAALHYSQFASGINTSCIIMNVFKRDSQGPQSPRRFFATARYLILSIPVSHCLNCLDSEVQVRSCTCLPQHRWLSWTNAGNIQWIQIRIPVNLQISPVSFGLTRATGTRTEESKPLVPHEACWEAQDQVCGELQTVWVIKPLRSSAICDLHIEDYVCTNCTNYIQLYPIEFFIFGQAVWKMVTFGCRKEQMELVQVRMGMGQWWKFCQVFLLSSQSSLLAARPGRVVCQPINQCSLSAYLDMKYYDIKPCCDIHLKIYGPFEALCCFFVLRCSMPRPKDRLHVAALGTASRALRAAVALDEAGREAEAGAGVIAVSRRDAHAAQLPRPAAPPWRQNGGWWMEGNLMMMKSVAEIMDHLSWWDDWEDLIQPHQE